MQRFLDPTVLAGISSLDLLAKTSWTASSPASTARRTSASAQEFAEYRAYTPGDDPRHIDWNLYARTDRTYLKRYRGDTNSQLTILLDASNSMQYTSGKPPRKMDYARYMAAALFYLAIRNQRDPAGLIVFDDEVRDYVPPSTRQGQLVRLLAASRQAEPRARTDFRKPLLHFQQLLHRRGMAIVLSDFYEDPDTIVRTSNRSASTATRSSSSTSSIPRRSAPSSKAPPCSSTSRPTRPSKSFPSTPRPPTASKVDAHIEQLRSAPAPPASATQLLTTDQPLDEALREYLTLRQAGN